MIQAAANSCGVTLPYWNWAIDHSAEGALQSAVWGPTRYGALNITTDTEVVNLTQWEQTRESQFSGKRVRDGQFGDGSAFGDEPIMRDWTGAPISTQSLDTLMTDLEIRETNKDVASSFPAAAPGANTSGFVTLVEQNFHNTMHCAIGGFMCTFISPYDPVFFLHHTFVDKIWKDWQDTHLDAHERYWASSSDWQLPSLLCGDQDNISSTDVEVSMHMTGSMNGVVNYWDRTENFACGDDWPKIQCCMDAVTQAGKWHEVARLQAGDGDVSDMCSPLNPSEFAHNQMWLNTLRDLGHMTQAEVDAALEAQHQDADQVNDALNVLPFEDFSKTTTCERSLCFAVTTGRWRNKLQGVCRRIQRRLQDSDRCWPSQSQSQSQGQSQSQSQDQSQSQSQTQSATASTDANDDDNDDGDGNEADEVDD